MIPIILTFILGLLEHGPAAIRELVQIGEQTGALTPEEAESFRSRMEAAFASRRWKTDAEIDGGGVDTSAEDTSTVPGG